MSPRVFEKSRRHRVNPCLRRLNYSGGGGIRVLSSRNLKVVRQGFHRTAWLGGECESLPASCHIGCHFAAVGLRRHVCAAVWLQDLDRFQRNHPRNLDQSARQRTFDRYRLSGDHRRSRSAAAIDIKRQIHDSGLCILVTLRLEDTLSEGGQAPRRWRRPRDDRRLLDDRHPAILGEHPVRRSQTPRNRRRSG